MTGPIPEGTWHDIVEHVPIVSVDLIVRHAGGVVLGKRTNRPGRGEWFVPGGRVRKDERLDAAVHRVAEAELGVDVRIEERLGVYEHLWDESEFDDVATKHYLANGVVVRSQGERFAADGQHSDLRVFEPPFPDLHPYVEAYLRDAGLGE
ncbi:NUDIX domain-containing protein [Haloplanus salinus]|jgi:colanic acid biosynthesis protein WcaH|uniref:NUDIX domain-containing protein n=1 Tax=Haloplanus salinus TaxID=1126245 RepID=A0A368NEW8_9EURY|nr:NUDIX domain-containing protein [Haloplanus salinus]RCU45056.1 NUDIX domain-containing protein [Haloplanus salinus]RCU47879.1 NUDIX domain-containing protein [Haloplanus salinus]